MIFEIIIIIFIIIILIILITSISYTHQINKLIQISSNRKLIKTKGKYLIYYILINKLNSINQKKIITQKKHNTIRKKL